MQVLPPRFETRFFNGCSLECTVRTWPPLGGAGVTEYVPGFLAGDGCISSLFRYVSASIRSTCAQFLRERRRLYHCKRREEKERDSWERSGDAIVASRSDFVGQFVCFVVQVRNVSGGEEGAAALREVEEGERVQTLHFFQPCL